MPIRIKRSVIRDPKGRIKFRTFNEGGNDHYHIAVWIDSDERTLDSIERVEYELHPGFRRPHRFSENRDNNFSVTFWTYGMFDMEVTVCHKNGTQKKLSYYLKYELPADTGENYIDVTDD